MIPGRFTFSMRFFSSFMVTFGASALKLSDKYNSFLDPRLPNARFNNLALVIFLLPPGCPPCCSSHFERLKNSRRRGANAGPAEKRTAAAAAAAGRQLVP
eukprot:TRINITY_DN588_c14_g1_i1.p2 TRINITY_DN588_c14_g1~~TRINITY_DN588_c14_g1_i1.p2  ORF type:complete len:100 (-),score=6.45 TRINITY_DN588_c14_g1_i1:141-440(-)